MLCRWVMHIIRNGIRDHCQTQHAPRGGLEQQRGQEQEEDRAELVREAANRSGSSVSGTIAPSRLQTSTAAVADRSQHLLETRSAKPALEEREDRIPRYKRRPASTRHHQRGQPFPETPRPSTARIAPRRDRQAGSSRGQKRHRGQKARQHQGGILHPERQAGEAPASSMEAREGRS